MFLLNYSYLILFYLTNIFTFFCFSDFLFCFLQCFSRYHFFDLPLFFPLPFNLLFFSLLPFFSLLSLLFLASVSLLFSIFFLTPPSLPSLASSLPFLSSLPPSPSLPYVDEGMDRLKLWLLENTAPTDASLLEELRSIQTFASLRPADRIIIFLGKIKNVLSLYIFIYICISLYIYIYIYTLFCIYVNYCYNYKKYIH